MLATAVNEIGHRLTLDDKTSKICHGSTRSYASDGVKEAVPDFNVKESFKKLLFLKFLVGDTSSILAKTFNRNSFFPVIEELRSKRGIRHIQPKDSGPEQTGNTKNDEKPSPSSYRGGVYVTNAICHKRLKDDREAITTVPVGYTQRDRSEEHTSELQSQD